MKITVEFDMRDEEDKIEHGVFVRSLATRRALDCFYERVREMLKYQEDLPAETRRVLEELRAEVREEEKDE